MRTAENNRERLHVLLISNYFPPEIGSAAHLYYTLAKHFVRRGHEVTVLTGVPRYNVDVKVYDDYVNKVGKAKYLLEESDGIRVIRAKLPLVERERLLRRGIEHFEVAYKMWSVYRRIGELRPADVSLVYSPPLPLFWTAKKIREKNGTPFILNVQDLYPQAPIDLGVLKNKLIIKLFRAVEKEAYRSADLITVHSQNNKEFVEKVMGWRNADKVIVFENWVDDDLVTPGEKHNEFAKKLGLLGKFVVSYAGTLGFSQDVQVVLQAAQRLKKLDDIVFLFVGDGVRKAEVEKGVQELGLKNVKILPTVPHNEYVEILRASDVSLATLQKSVLTPVVPSKILSIMSAAVPVIAAVNPNNDSVELIRKANCGFTVDAGDYEGLSEAILRLYRDRTLRENMGKNGRKYVEEHLSAKKAAQKYEEIFYNLIAKRG